MRKWPNQVPGTHLPGTPPSRTLASGVLASFPNESKYALSRQWKIPRSWFQGLSRDFPRDGCRCASRGRVRVPIVINLTFFFWKRVKKLTTYQMVLAGRLFHLARLGEQTTPTKLAKELNFSLPNVRCGLKRLASHGLVPRGTLAPQKNSTPTPLKEVQITDQDGERARTKRMLRNGRWVRALTRMNPFRAYLKLLTCLRMHGGRWMKRRFKAAWVWAKSGAVVEDLIAIARNVFESKWVKNPWSILSLWLFGKGRSGVVEDLEGLRRMKEIGVNGFSASRDSGTWGDWKLKPKKRVVHRPNPRQERDLGHNAKDLLVGVMGRMERWGRGDAVELDHPGRPGPAGESRSIPPESPEPGQEGTRKGGILPGCSAAAPARGTPVERVSGAERLISWTRGPERLLREPGMAEGEGLGGDPGHGVVPDLRQGGLPGGPLPSPVLP